MMRFIPLAALAASMTLAVPAAAQRVSVEAVEFPSRDGKTMIKGYVFKADNAPAQSPAVVMMHGRAGAYSSMKMIVGATARARANSRAICCSLSPYHLDRRSDDLIAMKFASDSRAAAFASKVLPVPGGP